MRNRCFWVNLRNPLYVRYHDDEWGVPCHDDRQLYELLTLECFQAGLSWECILNKREAFRKAYQQFNATAVATFGEQEITAMMAMPSLIRNRRKIDASIRNSRVFLDIQQAFGSFDAYIWQFTAGSVLYESCDIHVSSPLSDTISRDLKQRGMAFVGSTTVYSFLQAIGVINGHTSDCFRHVVSGTQDT